MPRFPLHYENVQAGRCYACRLRAILPWHFGDKQEKKLCGPCGNIWWEKLLIETGRIRDWRIMVGE